MGRCNLGLLRHAWPVVSISTASPPSYISLVFTQTDLTSPGCIRPNGSDETL